MTAWRPRRRRDDGRLYAIVRLGAAGIVYGVAVDTSDFKGNYPPFISVEAASIEGAYTEILCDERKETAVAFWQRANNYFTSCGITVQRVLTDNGSCYRSKLFAAALGEGVTHKRTRPYRPQTNGKVERFNRTLLDEWAYARLYRSEAERVAAFPVWLHTYNRHRGRTALGGATPASRVTNLSGQNS